MLDEGVERIRRDEICSPATTLQFAGADRPALPGERNEQRCVTRLAAARLSRDYSGRGEQLP